MSVEITDVAPLRIVSSLMNELEARQVPYCHWKSNEHLLAAVRGETDLDILFAPSMRNASIDALYAAGFLAYRAVWYSRYPGIEDYIGIDPETGKLVHVHAHFHLLIGESGVKSFHLRWEEEILQLRIRDEQTGVPIADPDHELLLLFIRAAIKAQFPTPLQRKTKLAHAMSDDEREFNWLKHRASQDLLVELANRHLCHDSKQIIRHLFDVGPQKEALAKLFLASAPMLRRSMRWSPLRAVIERWVRRLAYIGTRIGRKVQLLNLPQKRVRDGRGVIVTVLGADGSGKSTLVSGLTLSLGVKVDVLQLYLGSGDGPSSFLRSPLVILRSFLRKRRSKYSHLPKSGESLEASRSGGIKGLGQILWALTLANEKDGKRQQAARARARGMFVVTDRYPQCSIEGYNDGPLLGHLASHRLLLVRWLSQWERRAYLSDRRSNPDLVIKLIGDPEILNARRDDMDISTIITKQEGIKSVEFPNSRVALLNAADPAAIVLSRAMNLIGEVTAASEKR